MPRVDFTTALAKLQTSNLMSGEVIKGQAKLLEAQTKGTRDIITDFNARLQELEQEPLTTEEQLNALNKDPVVSEDMVDLEEQLSNFASFSVNILRRQEELNKLYGGTIQNLGYVGGESAGNLAGILQGQQQQKLKSLKEQRRLPFETQAYKQSMYQIETMKLGLIQGSIKLEDLKQDREVAQLMANMVAGDEYAKLNLIFNQATGKKGFNLDNFRDQMFLQYGDRPGYAKAWAGVDALIRQNTLNWRSQFSSTGNTGANLMERTLLIQKKYGELYNASKRMGAIMFGNGENETEDFGWVRDEYNVTASALFPDVKANANAYKFGSNLKVISQMLDPTAKGLAEEVYDIMYNNTSDQYYNKNYNDLTKLYGVPVTPYYRATPEGEPDAYPLPNGGSLDASLIIVPLDTQRGSSLKEKMFGQGLQGLFPGGEGGYWNPYDPAMFQGETDIDKVRKEMLRKKQLGLAESNVSEYIGNVGTFGRVGSFGGMPTGGF